MTAVLQSRILWIAIGGAAGSVARYLLASSVQRLFSTLFPLGTLAVNILGCLAIGFLMVRTESSVIAAHYRLGILVGFLGGFTTFSTFSAETLNLIEKRETLQAAGNILISVLACLVACGLGQRLARGMAG